MNTDVDKIKIILPFKAEYVSTVRLLASSMANRVGFDIDTIEDIKVAISEVCNKLIKAGSKTAESFSIVFEISAAGLKIMFCCEDESLRCIFDDDEEGLGIAIINALMDEVELCSKSEYLFSMFKAIEVNV